MRVLITGKDGQLGRELARAIPKGVTVDAHDRATLDITNPDTVRFFLRSAKPDVVINTAAYTAVDEAERDEATARSVNVDAVDRLAAECDEIGARLIHVSTDFVFGSAHSAPIPIDAKTDPANVYGRTKRDGEKRAIKRLKDQATIVRTSWLHSAFGGNFVRTMIGLMNERQQLGVVSDQVGVPTWAGTLARSIWKIVECDAPEGIWHVTDAGVASWYDFAIAIYEDASAFGLIESECNIRPIRTAEYKTPAARPTYSVLDTSRAQDLGVLDPQHWRTSLRSMLGDLLG